MAKMIFIDKPPMEGVDIFRACAWLDRAWNSLQNTYTVSRCFEKAGFRFESEDEMIPDPALNVTNQDAQQILDKEALIAGPPVVEDADQVLEMFQLFTAREDQEVDSVEEQADSSAILEPSEEPMNLESVIPPINTKEAMVHLSEL